jgi:hypothetical protein
VGEAVKELVHRIKLTGGNPTTSYCGVPGLVYKLNLLGELTCPECVVTWGDLQPVHKSDAAMVLMRLAELAELAEAAGEGGG